MKMKLTSPSTITYIQKKYDFKFSKSLGQNFIVNEGIIEDIVDGADIGPEDCVLEVGPGIGVLTEAMAQRADKVVAIELDSSLLPVLDEMLEHCDNVKVIHGDVLKVDLKKIIAEEFGGRKPKVVANLPYYVTTPIIMKFLEEHIPVTDLVVMIQKEVAQRMMAAPNSKVYGALSVAVQYYSDPSIAVNVPTHVFIPQPKVESAVIRLTIKENPPVELKDHKLFFGLVKDAFGKRRKTLLNSLSSGLLHLDKNLVLNALQSAGIDPKRRAETLSIEEFASLANTVYDLKNK